MEKHMKNGIIYSEENLRLIARLPEWIQELQDDYPNTVKNTAFDWDKPPIPERFLVEEIEIYYSDSASGPDISIYDGTLDSFNPREPEDSPFVIQVYIGGEVKPEGTPWSGFAYIQVEGCVLLDKIGVPLDGRGLIPEVLLSPDVFLQTVINNKLVEYDNSSEGDDRWEITF